MTESLSFQDQMLAKHQNDSMLQLNKTAVFMTTLTLVYLPSSFIAVCPSLCLKPSDYTLYTCVVSQNPTLLFELSLTSNVCN